MMDRSQKDRWMILAIRLFTWVTVFLLVVILGYVLYRGIWKREIVESERIPDSKNGYVVSGNMKAELDWEQLAKIVRGRTLSWRTLNGEDVPLTLIIDDASKEALAKDLHLGQVEIVATNTLSSKPVKGTLVIAPSTGRGMKELVVRNQVFAVHPSVSALRGNQQLAAIEKGEMEEILQGKHRLWSELGGPEIPIVKVHSLSELAMTEGAYLLAPASDFSQAEAVSSLKIRFVREGFNLTIPFLIQNTVDSGKYGGIRTIILNTIIFMLLITLVASPLGIASAVYLEEYAKRGRIYHVVSLGIDILGGIPSIIFGLFGMLVFVEKLRWGFCLASGTITVSLMVLPTIVRTSQDAIHAVSPFLREASYALGATRTETIWKVVVPSARRGIITGLILAVGRAIGETAALIYTIGSGTALATSISMPSRPLAMHVYLSITEGQGMDKAFATAFVLMVLVFVFDITANRLTAGKEHV